VINNPIEDEEEDEEEEDGSRESPVMDAMTL
jgi:hypothetical protein